MPAPTAPAARSRLGAGLRPGEICTLIAYLVLFLLVIVILVLFFQLRQLLAGLRPGLRGGASFILCLIYLLLL